MSTTESAQKLAWVKSSLAFLTKKPESWAIPSAFVAIFILATRIFTVRPAIMQDEYLYTRFSRTLPMSEAPVPDYLFYWLFSTTKTCGPNFYSCGKFINILLLVVLAILVFLIASKFVSKAWSYLAAIATLASPIGYYASFFMPEMMFFVAVVSVIFIMTHLTLQSNWKAWSMLGLALGLASLTKPHALFLGAVIAVYVVYLATPDFKKNLRKATTFLVVTGLTTIVAKFGVGYLFAGSAGITLFGASYSGAITSGAENLVDDGNVSGQSAGFAQFIGTFGSQTWAHLMALAVLFAVPTILGFALIRNSDPTSERARFSFIVIASAVVGIISISAFTSLLTVNGSNHSERIMVRYYDYLVPLMYLLIVLVANSKLTTKIRKASMLVLVLMSVTSLIGLISNFSPFKPVFYDGTSLVGVIFSPVLGWVLLAVSITALAGFFAKNSRFFKCSSIGLLISLSFGLSLGASASLIPSSGSDRFDYAADFVNGYLDDSEKASLTVISHEDYALARALTQIDDPDVDYRVVKKGETFGAKYLDEGKTWVLLMGNVFLDQRPCIQIQGNGYLLQKLCDGREYFFNQPLPNQFVSSVSGIGESENWGAWTVGNTATINFSKPLPANAKIVLTMAVPKYLQDQTFTASVAGSEIEFQLTEEAIDGEFEFQNSIPTAQLVIQIPNARSEKSEGISEDSRSVGIMLYKVKVIE